jgi:hypothetical protein
MAVVSDGDENGGEAGGNSAAQILGLHEKGGDAFEDQGGGGFLRVLGIGTGQASGLDVGAAFVGSGENPILSHGIDSEHDNKCPLTLN